MNGGAKWSARERALISYLQAHNSLIYLQRARSRQAGYEPTQITVPAEWADVIANGCYHLGMRVVTSDQVDRPKVQ